MGWTGGYLLLAVFLGPYLRQFGAYTIPDFLGARYGGNLPRIIGVVAAITCSFTYLIAQVTGVGLIVARFIGIDYNIGVFVGLIGVLFCSVLGGMKSVTWTQVAQYIILIISYLVPVVYLSWTIFGLPVPELTYGKLLQQNNATEIRLTARPERERDPRAVEERGRRAWRQAQDERASATRKRQIHRGAKASHAQARPLAASDEAKFGHYAERAHRHRHVELPRLDFLSDGRHRGIAAYPHALLHNAVGAPGAHFGGVVIVLYFSALFHRAGLCRLRPFRGLREPGRHKNRELPGWVKLWEPAGLFDVIDKNGDGIVQWADFVVKSTDFVVLSMPEVAGLPFVITGLVMAGGLAAALSTADGLLLTIANAISHDLYYKVINPKAR